MNVLSKTYRKVMGVPSNPNVRGALETFGMYKERQRVMHAAEKARARGRLWWHSQAQGTFRRPVSG